jgi:hypothetical protein
MGAQDSVEKVLRSLHVLLSKSEPAKEQPGKVIVEQQKMIDLLTDLNKGIYALMDEYELTMQSRSRAEREFQKQGDDIVRNANHQAEDIYAASVMYTDEALNHVQEIVRISSAAIQNVYEEMQQKMKAEVQTLKTNQFELKSQLQNLVDTDKYLKLIEERNREIAREKERNEGRTRSSERAVYANRMTEIRVNKERMAKLGLSDEEEKILEETKTGAESVAAAANVAAEHAAGDTKAVSAEAVKTAVSEETKEAEVRVNLDADYFRWKEEQSEANTSEHRAEDRNTARKYAEKADARKSKKSRISMQTDEDGMSIIKLDTQDDEQDNFELPDGIQKVWKSLTAGWR